MLFSGHLPGTVNSGVSQRSSLTCTTSKCIVLLKDVNFSKALDGWQKLTQQFIPTGLSDDFCTRFHKNQLRAAKFRYDHRDYHRVRKHRACARRRWLALTSCFLTVTEACIRSFCNRVHREINKLTMKIFSSVWNMKPTSFFRNLSSCFDISAIVLLYSFNC